MEEDSKTSLERASIGSPFSVDDRLYRGASIFVLTGADLIEEERLFTMHAMKITLDGWAANAQCWHALVGESWSQGR